MILHIYTYWATEQGCLGTSTSQEVKWYFLAVHTFKTENLQFLNLGPSKQSPLLTDASKKQQINQWKQIPLGKLHMKYIF